ncbi:MAG: hypothetical protein RLZZ500_869 [Bacteroidota bacterium]|jgi:antitoxin component YwqK of YwqJK toxin-antitoxin module
MKRYIVLAAVLIGGLATAQQSKPVLEEVNGMVKVTYYYENGKIQQEGFYKDGKLEGKWVSYDEQGNKVAIAEYTSGEKTGKWFFWNDKNLSEVDYTQGAVAEVKVWSKEAIANKN